MRIIGDEAERMAKDFQSAFDDLGYAFFANRDYNLNIIGVRNDFGLADKFDDKLNILYKIDDAWVIDCYVITTEPGPNILQRPLNSVAHKGTAILVPNQYRSAYRIGTHGGSRRYKAVVQRGEVEVWRDNNRDRKADIGGPSEKGLFGINIHRQWGPDDREYTGGVSAGCQVFQSSLDFYQFMETCQIASEEWGNSFTYTLVDERELSKTS
jgi:hypothetical protein